MAIRRKLTWTLLAFLQQLSAADARAIALGRGLFFDQHLSRDGKLSCAGCHEPNHAFTDQRPLAVGVRGATGTRRVPTLINRGAGKSFFWDGRAASLEQQVIQPVLNSKEMGMTRESTEALLASEPYRSQFRALFEGAPTLEELAVVLATYVRTIVSDGSLYDRFEQGDKTALTREEIRGLFLFRQKARCTACHFGPNLTDESFHNTGIGSRSGAQPDSGRAAVTGAARDHGAFKTPTLRDVARRAPYMHDGSFGSLEQVLDYYDRGGEGAELDPRLRPLRLSTDEKRDIIAYLNALNGCVREGN